MRKKIRTPFRNSRTALPRVTQEIVPDFHIPIRKGKIELLLSCATFPLLCFPGSSIIRGSEYSLLDHSGRRSLRLKQGLRSPFPTMKPGTIRPLPDCAGRRFCLRIGAVDDQIFSTTSRRRSVAFLTYSLVMVRGGINLRTFP